MAYRIRPARKTSREVRKAALNRLDKAIEALGAPPAERAEGIHQARKRFKELRALLRLVRKPLGKHFADDNLRLRDAGRRLAESRDATAMLESWEALARRNPPLFDSEPFRQIRSRLQTRAAPGSEAHGELDDEVTQVLAELRVLSEELQHWKLRGRGFALLAAGLRRTYAEGAQDLVAAEENGTDELLHEWRKRVKDHWYHCQLLAPCWPKALECRAEQLKQLADALGDDHDLAMMTQLMQAEPELFGTPESHQELEACINARRAQLRQRALRLGHRLYAESPKALVKRVGAYWRIASSEKD